MTRKSGNQQKVLVPALATSAPVVLKKEPRVESQVEEQNPIGNSDSVTFQFTQMLIHLCT